MFLQGTFLENPYAHKSEADFDTSSKAVSKLRNAAEKFSNKEQYFILATDELSGDIVWIRGPGWPIEDSKNNFLHCTLFGANKPDVEWIPRAIDLHADNLAKCSVLFDRDYSNPLDLNFGEYPFAIHFRTRIHDGGMTEIGPEFFQFSKIRRCYHYYQYGHPDIGVGQGVVELNVAKTQQFEERLGEPQLAAFSLATLHGPRPTPATNDANKEVLK